VRPARSPVRGGAPPGLRCPGSRNPRARSNAGPGVPLQALTTAGYGGNPAGRASRVVNGDTTPLPDARTGFNGVFYAPGVHAPSAGALSRGKRSKAQSPARPSWHRGSGIMVADYPGLAGSRDEPRDAGLRARRAMPGRNRVTSPTAPPGIGSMAPWPAVPAIPGPEWPLTSHRHARAAEADGRTMPVASAALVPLMRQPGRRRQSAGAHPFRRNGI
jgi:hypothetical protein